MPVWKFYKRGVLIQISWYTEIHSTGADHSQTLSAWKSRCIERQNYILWTAYWLVSSQVNDLSLYIAVKRILSSERRSIGFDERLHGISSRTPHLLNPCSSVISEVRPDSILYSSTNETSLVFLKFDKIDSVRGSNLDRIIALFRQNIGKWTFKFFVKKQLCAM